MGFNYADLDKLIGFEEADSDGTFSYDDFDASLGVKIEQPAPAPAPVTAPPTAITPTGDVEKDKFLQNVFNKQPETTDMPEAEGYKNFGESIKSSLNEFKNLALNYARKSVKNYRAFDKELQEKGISKVNAFEEGFTDMIVRMPEEDRFEAEGLLQKIQAGAGNIVGGVTEFALLSKAIPTLPIQTKIPIVGNWVANMLHTTTVIGASSLVDELAQEDPDISDFKDRFKEQTPYLLAFGVAPYVSGLRYKTDPQTITLMKGLLGRGYKLATGASIATLESLRQGKDLKESVLTGIQAGGMVALTGSTMLPAGVPLGKAKTADDVIKLLGEPQIRGKAPTPSDGTIATAPKYKSGEGTIPMGNPDANFNNTLLEGADPNAPQLPRFAGTEPIQQREGTIQGGEAMGMPESPIKTMLLPPADKQKMIIEEAKQVKSEIEQALAAKDYATARKLDDQLQSLNKQFMKIFEDMDKQVVDKEKADEKAQKEVEKQQKEEVKADKEAIKAQEQEVKEAEKQIQEKVKANEQVAKEDEFYSELDETLAEEPKGQKFSEIDKSELADDLPQIIEKYDLPENTDIAKYEEVLKKLTTGGYEARKIELYKMNDEFFEGLGEPVDATNIVKGEGEYVLYPLPKQTQKPAIAEKAVKEPVSEQVGVQIVTDATEVQKHKNNIAEGIIAEVEKKARAETKYELADGENLEYAIDKLNAKAKEEFGKEFNSLSYPEKRKALKLADNNFKISMLEEEVLKIAKPYTGTEGWEDKQRLAVEGNGEYVSDGFYLIKDKAVAQKIRDKHWKKEKAKMQKQFKNNGSTFEEAEKTATTKIEEQRNKKLDSFPYKELLPPKNKNNYDLIAFDAVNGGELMLSEYLTPENKVVVLNPSIVKFIKENTGASDMRYNPDRNTVYFYDGSDIKGVLMEIKVKPKEGKEIVSSSSPSGSTPKLPEKKPIEEKPIKGGGYRKTSYNEKALGGKKVKGPIKDYSNVEIKKDDVNYIRDYLKVLAPAQISSETKIAAGLLRNNMGKLAQQDSAVKKSFQKARKELGKLSNVDVVEFIDNIEKGEPQKQASLQPISDAFRKLMDGRRDKVIALGKGQLGSYIENYFPHIWEDPSRAKKVIANIMGKRRIVGSKSFLKERKIDLFKEGVEAGLEPVSWNPVDIVMLRSHEMDKYVLAQELIGDLKARGLVKFVYSRSKTPDGYKRIDDSAFTVFHPPELKTSESFDKILVEQLMDVSDALGINTRRLLKLSGNAEGLAYGRYGASGGERIRTKFSSPESVLAHEIGHVLGYRYKIYDIIRHSGEGKMRTVQRGKKAGQEVFKPDKEAVAWRKTIDVEWRALADMRFGGMDASNSFKQYVRKAREKEAVLLEALIHAPEMFKKVAPTLYTEFNALLNKHSVLRPLLDVKPSVVLGVGGARIPIPGFTTVGYFAAKEDVADLINNHLSAGLKSSSNRIVRDGYTALRGVGNLLNQVQLSLSWFHGLNVTTDMIATSIGLGARRLTTKQQKTLGLFNIITGPLAPIKYTWDGVRIKKAYNQSLDSIKDPEMKAMVEAIVLAGGRDKMDTFYYNNAIEHLSTTFRDITRSKDFKKIATGAMKLPLDLFGATFEALAKPLMEWYVPAGKLGVFADIAKHEIKRYDDGEMGLDKDKLMLRLISAWDNVDNTMGQLIYDNLFWNKYLKDVAMLSVRSVGWTLGSVREVAGAFVDIPTTKTRLEEGDKLFSIRQAQVLGWIVTYTMIGAVLTYLMTGKAPKTPKDYFFPKTGKLNTDGSEQRLNLPTYSKDAYAWKERPLHTAKAKMHPLWGLGMDLAQNKDFFNVQIRNPKDPIHQQMIDAGKYIYETSLPLSIKNYKRMNKSSGGIGNVFVSITGVSTAPSYINRSVAQKLMYRYIIEKIPNVTKTHEEFEVSQYRSNFINKLRRGDPVDREEAVKILGHKRYVSAVKTSKETSFANSFKRLSLEQALNVYAIATPKEKKESSHVLFKKFKNAFDAHKVTPEIRSLYNEVTK